MKKYILFVFAAAILLVSCKSTSPDEIEQMIAKTPVEITTIKFGSIDDQLVLTASSVYLKRNVITSEIPAFITLVNIRLGDKISKGQLLYELQTKESKALGKTGFSADTLLGNIGKVKIYAPADGIITTLDKQQTGDYVLEGGQLCTLAESSDLAFQVNVPFEFVSYTKAGTSCIISTPDNSKHSGTFTKPLAAMNATSQTETILAKCNEPLFLPENLIVKILVSRTSAGRKQILPKACVLSDEMMQEFWVMKLTNDTTAVKVPVVPGTGNASEMEINSPDFGPDDRIIVKGNYGLKDTARVSITK